ncbi:MAG: D-2-hydroxyacid dehydrogenase [Candidatus Binatia bacterium]|nr:D-2-hydroxyacid dehydrogenase [Candidatus Binatia bacterium]
MAPAKEEPIVVCLGFPAMHDPAQLDALRAIDPRIEPVPLPVDPASDWISPPPAEPHDEPPAWGATVAVERAEALARAEVLIGLHTPSDLMRRAPRLKWIHSVGAGVDGWVAAGVSADRVFVTNSSGLGARSIAEFVLGRLLQIWKNLRGLEAAQREHEWVGAHGRTFGGTTMGIVGLGAIGEEVAIRARAFGVRVLALKRSYRPGMTSPVADELFGPGDLHAMVARCDTVVVAAPHTPETEGLIDAEALAAMPQGSVLVNVARGPLVDSAALLEAMRSGHLGAAVLDVFDEEPLPASSPFWDLPNTYVSPHGAVAVDRYMEDLFELFAENLRRYATGEPMRNRVDMDALGFRRGA